MAPLMESNPADCLTQLTVTYEVGIHISNKHS